VQDPIDQTSDTRKCMNCGAELRGDYCSNCGQSSNTTQLRFGKMVKEVFAGLVDFDKPLYRTLIGLTIRPGKITSDYVDGKRKHYTNPIKYILSTSAILILAIKFRGTIVEVASNTAVQNPNLPEKFSEFISQYFQLAEKAAPYTQIETLLLMPVLAWFLSKLFRKSNHTVAEHFAFGCFIYGHISLFIAILLAFNLHHLIYQVVSTLVTIFPFVYLTWGAIVFNRNKFFPGLIRTAAAYGLFMLFTQILYVAAVLIKMLII
jgi:Protein of unknown function (DUF3667)